MIYIDQWKLIVVKKCVRCIPVAVIDDDNIENIIDVANYSDIGSVLRITVWVIRFCENLRQKSTGKKSQLSATLTSTEIQKAKRLWIKANQVKLRKDGLNNKMSVNLNIINCDGVLRCQGRFKNICNDKRYPVILDRRHPITKLFVMDANKRVYHNGLKQTLVEFRNEFYITRARQFVRGLCVTCKKIHGRPYKYPPFSQLPIYRQVLIVPFSVCGVDYCGPVYVGNLYDDEMYKAFIVIYTCAATRGILIDLVENGSSKTFINSMRKFIGRRGCPAKFVSDNGTVFKSEDTQMFCANRCIKWDFNVSRAPWWGGFWERLIASVKKLFKKGARIG